VSVITTESGARRLGSANARGLAPWATTRLEAPEKVPIEITATPCRHGPPLSHPIVGDVIGFALKWEGQESGRLWISGDTVLYDGVREVPRRIDVGVAVLHLGGVTFPWLSARLRYTMTGEMAAQLCAEMPSASVVPIHYEGWRHFTQGRSGAEAAFAAAPGGLAQRIRWLAIGSPATLAV
jgi:L-ascorbate metabolism protein UlaG (beta-lactamase superfamily)